MPSRRPTLWSEAISPVALLGRRTIPTTPRPSIAPRSSTIPTNELLLEQAFQLEVSRADWPRAFKLAGQLASVQKQNRLAQLALAINDFKNGDYKKSEDHFKRAGSGPIGELTSALAMAWVKYAEGDVNGALATLDLPKQAEWAQFYLRYHRALIADLAGRKQEARTAYERTAAAGCAHLAHGAGLRAPCHQRR